MKSPFVLAVCLTGFCVSLFPASHCNANHDSPPIQAQQTQPGQGGDNQVHTTQDQKKSENSVKTRSFDFTYSGKITAVKKGQTVRIWIPIPQTTADQSVKILEKDFPTKAELKEEKKYGNLVYFMELTPKSSDPIPFSVTYRIVRKEVKGLVSGKLTPGKQKISDNFLNRNRLVPTDGKPIELYQQFVEKNGKKVSDSAVKQAEQFYEFVYQHLQYDKSKPGYGKGDVLWACDSKTGNCTDFHSLFISVARNRKIPAKFQIGFPLPSARGEGTIGGYHCWARFYSPEFGWIPVDISEADKNPKMKKYFFGNLTENRVLFSTGRDLELEPKNQSGPVNYLVYPLVEVDGKAIEKKDLNMEFRYKDVKEK